MVTRLRLTGAFLSPTKKLGGIADEAQFAHYFLLERLIHSCEDSLSSNP